MRTSQSHPLTVSLFKARQGFHRVLSDFAVRLSLQVVTKWGPDEVSQWLESVGLPMYCHAFKEHEISGTELLSLERRDFKDVGVTKVKCAHAPKRPWMPFLCLHMRIYILCCKSHNSAELGISASP